MNEEVNYCSKCGSLISSSTKQEWQGHREECFGWERGGNYWRTIVIGVLILGFGVIFLLNSLKIIEWWPGILILIGVMVIIGGVIAQRRS